MSLRQRLGDFVLGVVPYALGVAFIAGIVHISSVFLMPRLAVDDAFSRVAAMAPLYRTTLVPPATRSKMPFEDPATQVGLCRYDLSQGPLLLKGQLPPDALMLFSFHARYGQVFYSMTDRGASRGRLDVLVLTPSQLEDVEADEADDELPKELRIVSPTMQGFVVFRALAEQPGDMPDAARRISSIGCSLANVPRS